MGTRVTVGTVTAIQQGRSTDYFIAKYNGIHSCIDTQNSHFEIYDRVIFNTHTFVYELFSTYPEAKSEFLGQLFEKIALQGSEPIIQDALRKTKGYLVRYVQGERGDIWLEHRTSLGKVASVYLDYTNNPFEFSPRLTQKIVLEASEEAEKLLSDPHARPSWKALSKETGGFLNVIAPESTCFYQSFKDVFLDIGTKLTDHKLLDVAFVIDTTRGMTPYLAQLKQSVQSILSSNLSPKVGSRFMIIEATDTTLFGSPRTYTKTEALHQLQQVEITKEKSEKIVGTLFVLTELQKSTDMISWQPGALRIIIFISSTRLLYNDDDYPVKDLLQACQTSQTTIYPIILLPGQDIENRETLHTGLY
jgi:hypothetical protein